MKKDKTDEYKVRSLDAYKQNQEKRERPVNKIKEEARTQNNSRTKNDNKHKESREINEQEISRNKKHVRRKVVIKEDRKKNIFSSKKIRTKKIKRKSKASRKLLILNTALLSSAAGILFLLIILMNRYSLISELRYDINVQERTLNELLNKKREIQVQIEHSNRTDFIEQTAREQLFMEYPTEEETVYIRVD